MGKIESKFETPKMGEISIEETNIDVINENEAVMGAMIYEQPLTDNFPKSTKAIRQNQNLGINF